MGPRERRSVRRVRVAVVLGVLALLALLGSSASGQTVRAGNLIVTVEGGFTPHKLPKVEPASITLSARSTIRTADGTHLPALDFLKLEFDKHTGVYTKGLPVCTIAQLQNTLTTQAKAALPEGDHRQRPGRRRNRLPRTGALLRQGADGDLQRPAEKRPPRLHLPRLRPRAGADDLHHHRRDQQSPPASTAPASTSRSRRSSPARARSASPNSRSTKSGRAKGKSRRSSTAPAPRATSSSAAH